MAPPPSCPPHRDAIPALQRWRLAIAQSLARQADRSDLSIAEKRWSEILQIGVMTILVAALLRQRCAHCDPFTEDVSAVLGQYLPTSWQEHLTPLGGWQAVALSSPSSIPACPPLSIEDLGHLYELGLARPLVSKADGSVAIAPPASRKKTGGIYYTPRAIATYILEQILQPWEQQQNSTQGDRCPLPTLLDPACGSGIFLLVAYEQVTHYALRWYTQRGDRAVIAATPDPPIASDGQGAWHLTPEETRRILNHLYGIDQDADAVAVTRLSLQLAALATGPLPISPPELEQTILVGNALIQADGKHPEGLQASSAFAQVLQQGGFDGVVGNPPYIDAEEMTRHHAALRAYCSAHYRTAAGNWDLFCVFIERALLWCKPSGLHSFIVPNKLISAGYAAQVRSLLAHHRLQSIRSYADVPTFKAAVYPLVYVVQKQPASKASTLRYEVMADGERVAHSHSIPYSTLLAHPDSPWPLGNTPLMPVMARLQQNFPALTEVAEVCGAATVAEAYALKSLIQDNAHPQAQDLRVVNSGTIDRYHLLWGDRPMRYLGDRLLHPILPHDSQCQLSARRLHQATHPKILVAGLSKRLECGIDDQGIVLAAKSTSIVMSQLNLYYLLGLLNSQLIHRYIISHFGHNQLQGGYLRIGPPQLKSVPIAIPAEGNGTAESHTLIQWVQQCIALRCREGPQSLPMNALSQILELERQIDRLVYELYGVTEEEQNLIEASA